jgi:hypothetical protein
MRGLRLAMFVVVAGMLVLLASEAAFGATRTVIFQVDGCD